MRLLSDVLRTILTCFDATAHHTLRGMSSSRICAMWSGTLHGLSLTAVCILLLPPSHCADRRCGVGSTWAPPLAPPPRLATRMRVAAAWSTHAVQANCIGCCVNSLQLWPGYPLRAISTRCDVAMGTWPRAEVHVVPLEIHTHACNHRLIPRGHSNLTFPFHVLLSPFSDYHDIWTSTAPPPQAHFVAQGNPQPHCC